MISVTIPLYAFEMGFINPQLPLLGRGFSSSACTVILVTEPARKVAAPGKECGAPGEPLGLIFACGPLSSPPLPGPSSPFLGLAEPHSWHLWENITDCAYILGCRGLFSA